MSCDSMDSALGFQSRHPISRPGRVNCVIPTSGNSYRQAALTCFYGDCPPFAFIYLLLLSDWGTPVVSNKRLVLLLQLLC